MDVGIYYNGEDGVLGCTLRFLRLFYYSRVLVLEFSINELAELGGGFWGWSYSGLWYKYYFIGFCRYYDNFNMYFMDSKLKFYIRL